MLHISQDRPPRTRTAADSPIYLYDSAAVQMLHISYSMRSLMPHHTTGGQGLTLGSDRRRPVRDRAYVRA